LICGQPDVTIRPDFIAQIPAINHLQAGNISTMTGQLMKIDGPGEYAFDIVGESHYQDALNRIAGPKTEEGVEYFCEADLRPEPSNPHDQNAVAVFIDELKVGYLSSVDALAWTTALANANWPGGSSARVDAVIVGGWFRSGGREGSYGVKLDL
jgi:hypothetical protein